MNTRRLSLLSLMIAILLVQTTVPGLGYLPIGPLSLTIIPVTVMITAILFGTKEGTLIGFLWGAIAFLRSFFAPTSALSLVLTNPIIAIVPRLLIGLVVGLIFDRLMKRKAKVWKLSCLGALGSLINTVLFLGLIALFYSNNVHIIYQISNQALMPYLIATLFTNGIPEMIMDAILLPLIAKPLLKRIKH